MVQDIDSIVEQFLLRSQRSTSCEPRHHPRALYADKVRFLAGDIYFRNCLYSAVKSYKQESSKQGVTVYLLLKSILLVPEH